MNTACTFACSEQFSLRGVRPGLSKAVLCSTDKVRSCMRDGFKHDLGIQSISLVFELFFGLVLFIEVVIID